MNELAVAIRDEVERARARFDGWGDADVTRDRGAGKWVTKEILGHLIDSAVNNDDTRPEETLRRIRTRVVVSPPFRVRCRRRPVAERVG